jgi:Zn-dependent M28 family amino/carboxypeptidase
VSHSIFIDHGEKMKKILLIFLGLAFVVQASMAQTAIPAGAKEVISHFQSDRMRADVKFLSSDLLEGRGTGARGGSIAAEYIATQFQMAGLKPIGDNGTYMQKVPLIGLTTSPRSTLSVVPDQGNPMQLRYLDDFVANDLSLKKEETINAPLVFVGYGVEAPEFQWNDFEGIDVKGKVLLCLVNDPPSDDPKFFGGKAMTYYGRWTYKFEEASRKGAAGILIIHNTEAAAYGWQVVRNSNSGDQAYLKPDTYQVPMAGWVTEEVAAKIATAAGTDLATLMQKAKTKGFRAMELPIHIQAHLLADVRPLDASNVVGLLPGGDPKRNDEVILYTAHYDHLGIGAPVNGDSIYNGAIDNASGSALLLELARAFSESSVRPPRSVVFLAVTGEERGLLGSQYYGQSPEVPAKKTEIDLNYDAIQLWGETSDVTMTGAERTSVWPMVQDVAKALDYTISTDPHPEAGHYYRSDHFSLARVGVPAFSLSEGSNYVGQSPEYGQQKYKEYLTQHYHQPSDEYNPAWDFAGAKKLAALGIAIGWRVADMQGETGWAPGDEFEKARK